jgi:coenzyme F420-dependent glucose-6-phosphate dehydrogenase
MKLGYALSSEEHAPTDLVRNAGRAEETGFEFALISDHYHPWVDAQGHSPFVWNVIGGIAQETERLRLGTGVTCPLIRIHPAVIAQAAATSAAMMPGRFFLGVGTGENLNEHIVGEKWPAPDERLEMLEEAIEVIRLLWEGGYQTFRGDYFDVEQARLYTLPDEPPPIAVAASKPGAAEVAGGLGDALISVAPERELVEAYREAGGDGPCYGQVHVCWAASESEAKETAYRVWPNAAVGGELSQELALPRHFEQAAATVTADEVAERTVCGPDPVRYVEQVQQYVEAGFDHVYFHQVGPDQEGFFRFFAEELSPLLQRELATA